MNLPSTKRTHTNDENISIKNKKKKLSSNSTIQILPSELWLEIFSYFNYEELVYSFNYLNLFIQTLLCNDSLQIHLDMPLKKLKFLISPSSVRPTQIISLCVSYYPVDPFVTFDAMDISHFNRIHSLHLVSVNNEELKRISHLQLPDLYRICIVSPWTRYITTVICEYFPCIVRMKLNCGEREFIVEDPINREQSSQVKYLVLNGKLEVLSFRRLYRIIKHVRSISIINYGLFDDNYILPEDKIVHDQLNYLRSLKITITDAFFRFYNLTVLVQPTLEYLSIMGQMDLRNFCSYTWSSNWINLKQQRGVRLKKIFLFIHAMYYNNDQNTNLEVIINQCRHNIFKDIKVKHEDDAIFLKGFIE